MQAPRLTERAPELQAPPPSPSTSRPREGVQQLLKKYGAGGHAQFSSFDALRASTLRSFQAPVHSQSNATSSTGSIHQMETPAPSSMSARAGLTALLRAGIV